MQQILVECVPNFSEGRRTEVIEALAESIRKTAEVKLLDYSADADHNRSVFTFIGAPEAVKAAVLNAAEVAVKHIDMEKHQGAHPRIGAIDVVPFIPVKNITMAECVQLAHQVGEAINRKFNIPIYFYEAAAKRPECKNLAAIREGNYEGLKTCINQPGRCPDLGEPRLHPTAGATVVGAREFLIAFNINLNTSDLAIAKKIAKRVRGKDGGLTAVKAMGVMLKEKNLAQVSMNLVDFHKSSIETVYELVKIEAARYGVTVHNSEIIGLVPMEALVEVAKYYLRLEDFKAEQVLENHLL
jgi:glutamate formiminotransferase